jgi:2-polyprenyl-3-methyl-5-hydroxy-6-metoxy-1,4-benzoquinol methylase
VKRVHHDCVVDKITFQDTYTIVKDQYKHWVDLWCSDGDKCHGGMKTDPQKHVFEVRFVSRRNMLIVQDIAIATFLISLWKNESPDKKPRFIDIGCGNGFLVHILTTQGYEGFGVDLSKRKIWYSSMKALS